MLMFLVIEPDHLLCVKMQMVMPGEDAAFTVEMVKDVALEV